MANAKVAYTPEQTVELVTAYKAEPNEKTVERFAQKFGKSVKSVVAKLSREGVYVAKRQVKADGTTRRIKADVLVDLEVLVGEKLPSFENATMKDMEKVIAFIKREGQ